MTEEEKKKEEAERWFGFWQQAVFSQHSVMGSVSGLTVAALAVVAGFASANGGLDSLEKVVMVAIAILLGVHTKFLLETVRNDREASFISWTQGHGSPERISKSLRNNEIYKSMQYSLLAAWVLVLVLIILVAFSTARARGTKENFHPFERSYENHFRLHR